MNILYFRRFGKFIDFENPRCFTEKIQKKKLLDRDPLLTIAADKLLSKHWVSSFNEDLYIPKTIWEGESAADLEKLNISDLPSDYVYKANHTSQTIEIIRNSNHLSKVVLKDRANNWLKHDQSATLGEWAYENIPRRVFIEEFLDFEGQAPDDYKLFVYHGKVHFIQLDSDRFTDHKRNMFDRDWNDLGFSYSHLRKLPSPSKPEFVENMIDIAENVGAHFDFIRVDLYFYNGKVTFGELTIYPGAGFEKFPQIDFDLMFGDPW